MSENAVQVRTYGNWREPKAAGFGKLSFGASMGLLASMIGAVVIYSLVGMRWAMVFAAVSAGGLWAVSSKDRHGLSVADRTGTLMRFRRAKRRKATIYRSGPLSLRATQGTCKLPGILSASTLSEHVDAYDRPFALVRHGDGTLAVLMGVSPAGAALVDQDQVDQEVARWGMWLADLSGELGIVGASVTVETAPDSGARLRREVQSRTALEAPPVARRVLHDVVEEYRSGAAQVRSWVTVVFDPTRMSVRKRDQVQVARDIASRLPGLTQTLQATGAGAVHLLTAPEVCRLVRVAFDPASEALFEQAASMGDQVDISWDETGPVGADVSWDAYRHDSGVSRTWVVTRPPRGVIQSGLLANILATSRDVDRKRVTILYRPLDGANAPDLVEGDLNKARARVEAASRPTARDMTELQAAQQVAMEEASGAGLVDFGILITATTTSEDLDDTASAVASLAASSRLQVRTAFGAQDSAFALALPLGLRPTAQMLGGGW